MTPRTLDERLFIALTAFLLHHPGVRWRYGLRQRLLMRNINAAALSGSILAAVLIGSAYDWPSAAWTFVACHFTWSAVYSWLVWRHGPVLLTPAEQHSAEQSTPRVYAE